MSKIPLKIKNDIHARVWSEADGINWLRLGDVEKSRQYEKWMMDPNVGGVIGQFVDQRNIRVYLKDSVMKPYNRERTKGIASIFGVLGIPETEVCRMEWIKPHGRILFDHRCLCWGPAKDWKSIILSVYERAHRNPPSTPFAAVFVGPLGKMAQSAEQNLVADVARKLGLKKIVWGETIQIL
jgi:hypothetical protein